ncbi:hypothetical protein TrLO_g12308 [Triparma laevis f. longispina]|uniref:Uncharacterized protein n=1 Tax=Triparma laevis f. longispina TaxID=1714387 RepID=A0A9W7FR02_9STRA|nr:hypothetical protein TrLO_g12308 [Triparma laevis f. longispina]
MLEGAEGNEVRIRRPPGRAAAAPSRPLAGTHTLDQAFLSEVEKIYLPAFGTENLAPLLHSLVKFHRPHLVVELGYGYTTPFLAQGLADNIANVAAETADSSVLRKAGVLHNSWYAEQPWTLPKLVAVDDQSQRDASAFAASVNAVLEDLGLRDLVELKASMQLEEAHALFENDSIGLLWNDAQWDPEFFRKWWPLVKKDGGLMLLHNAVGNGEVSRWCVASPRRVMQELFPDEEFEFITLIEPHKAYQGSVAMLRRLDPVKAPDKYGYFWGGHKEGTRQFEYIMDAMDWVPPGAPQPPPVRAEPKEQARESARSQSSASPSVATDLPVMKSPRPPSLAEAATFVETFGLPVHGYYERNQEYSMDDLSDLNQVLSRAKTAGKHAYEALGRQDFAHFMPGAEQAIKSVEDALQHLRVDERTAEATGCTDGAADDDAATCAAETIRAVLPQVVTLKKILLCHKLGDAGREKGVFTVLSSTYCDVRKNNHICPVCVLPDFSIEYDNCFMCDEKPFSEFSVKVLKKLCCSKIEKDDDNAKKIVDLYYKYKK